MRILLAPDKFKDALTADAVCAAMEAGLRRARPDARVTRCPLADGGEGTGPLLAQALHAEARGEIVLDPLGRECAAEWWDVTQRGLAIVEMARASGLWLLEPRERNASRTTSYGTGQLLRAAWDAGAERILMGVGGSATVDGGAGCLQALGWRLHDAAGRFIHAPACGALLPRVASLQPPPEPEALALEILCDVNNPLLGPQGAAPVFAPQKGATPDEVVQLSAALHAWADVLEHATGRAVRELPGAGAAGGLPAALAAAYGATLVPGFHRVADLVGLDHKLGDCDLCLTGEGRLDEQTAGGKVVAGVARRARAVGVPVVAFVGELRLAGGQTPADLARALGVRDIAVITPPDTPHELALAQTPANLERAVAAYFAP